MFWGNRGRNLNIQISENDAILFLSWCQLLNPQDLLPWLSASVMLLLPIFWLGIVCGGLSPKPWFPSWLWGLWDVSGIEDTLSYSPNCWLKLQPSSIRVKTISLRHNLNRFCTLSNLMPLTILITSPNRLYFMYSPLNITNSFMGWTGKQLGYIQI